MARDIEMDVIARKDSNALTQMANELDRAASKVDTLSSSSNRLGTSLADVDRRLIDTRRQVAALGDEWLRTGDKMVLADLRRARAEEQNFERVRRELVRMASVAGSETGTMFVRNFNVALSNPYIAVAIAAAIGSTLPAIGAMVAGAVTGAVGVGGIAGGIAAASRDPGVRSAASQLGDTISQEFFAAGPQFVQPTIQAIRVLEDAFRDIDIAGTLAPAARLVPDLARGLAGFGKQFAEGFGQALANAEPFIDVLEEGLPEIGAALGDFVTDLSESEGAVEGFNDLLRITEGTIRGTGQTLAWLGDQYNEFKGIVEFSAGLFEGLSPLTLLTSLLRNGGVASGIAARALALIPPHLLEVEESARGASVGLQEATAALYEFEDATLSSQRADIALADALDDLDDVIKDNGRTLDLATEAGRANRDAILDVVYAAQRQREANIAAGMSAAQAGQKYRQQINDLEALLTHLGFTKAMIEQIIGAFGRIPHTITTRINLVTGTSGSNTYASAGLGGRFTERAEGGQVFAGEIYRINELESGRRVELFRPAMNGTVIPLSAQGAAGGGGGATEVNVYVGGQLLSQQQVRVSQRSVRDEYLRAKQGVR